MTICKTTPKNKRTIFSSGSPDGFQVLMNTYFCSEAWKFDGERATNARLEADRVAAINARIYKIKNRYVFLGDKF